jgi:ABC-type branched-subunit amino acid transport system permease subunit
VLNALAAQARPSWTEGAVETGGRLTGAIEAWVLLPVSPGRAPELAYVVLVAGLIVATRLQGWARLATLPPLLYLTAFVWENLMIQQPAVTRLVLFGALLVVLMQVRPQGLLGTARVEIV